MLGKRLKNVVRVDVSDLTVKTMRRAVFEYELTYALIRIGEAKRKYLEFENELDDELDSRLEFFFAFAQLADRNPVVMEKDRVPFFVRTIREGINQISDKEYAVKLEALLFQVETELVVLSCSRYYFFNDDGKDNPNVEESYLRFMEAAARMIPPMIVHKFNPDQEKNDMILERNFRLNEILEIKENGNFDYDKFVDFLETLDENFVYQCARQLVVETQLSLFGPVQLPVINLADAAIVQPSTSQTSTRASAPNPPSEQPTVSKRSHASDTTHKKKEGSSPLPNRPPERIVPAATAARVAASGEKRRDPPRNTPQANTPPIQDDQGGMSKRQRVSFQPDEDEALQLGYAKYGQAWAKILADPEFGPVFKRHKERTAVNIKDRWRTLSGRGQQS